MQYPQDQLVEVPCALCGHPAGRVIVSDYAPLLIRSCPQCGHLYTSPRLTDSALASLYNADYFERGEEGSAFGYADYAEQEKAIRHTARLRIRWIKKLLGTNPAKNRLLEVGSAYGFFLDEARQAGFQIGGVEPAATARARANRLLKKQMVEAELANVTGLFDVVVLWDVLEHLPDPLATLRQIDDKTPRGALLAIITPNSASFPAKFFQHRWLIFASPQEHLHFFNPATIRRLLLQAGYASLEIITFGRGGKKVKLSYIFRRLAIYNRLFQPLSLLVEHTFLRYRAPYVDWGDNMWVLARKR
jgi:2-polyprenyl-3-methyl-5-hydroxy-6-metoxy-1,4-benzoquinol methylase